MSLSMRRFRSKQLLSVWAAIAVLVIQPQFLIASERSIVKSSTTAHTAQALIVVDVALQDHGVLHGQIMDKQGQPLSDIKIQILSASSDKQWQTQTDAKGRAVSTHGAFRRNLSPRSRTTRPALACLVSGHSSAQRHEGIADSPE